MLHCCTLCQIIIILCLLSSLSLLLCACFSPIYCYAKHLHDHRWEAGFFFGCSFYSSFFSLPHPRVHTWTVYVFIWKTSISWSAASEFFKCGFATEISAARDTRGSLCCFGQGRFLWLHCEIICLLSMFPGSISTAFKDFHWKMLFPCSAKFPVWVSHCWAVFRTVLIKISCSTELQNPSKWRRPTRIIRLSWLKGFQSSSG